MLFFFTIGIEIFINYAISFYRENKEIKNKFILLLIILINFFDRDFINIFLNAIEIEQYNTLLGEGSEYLKNYKGNYYEPEVNYLFICKKENFNNLKEI